MKKTENTLGRGMEFLAAVCYLVSLTACGALIYGLAQLIEGTAGGAVRQIYPTAGMF